MPAEGYVAGDCYDVTLVSPHQLGIIVLDIAGHGAAQAIAALVDTRTGICAYANGGHPPALLAHDERPLRELEPTGPLIGPFPGAWRTEQFAIEAGGKLVVYTDGLSEARNAARAFYGTERLARIVASLPCREAEPVLKSCLDDLVKFSPERLLDDVTMVLVCRICDDDHGAPATDTES